MTPLTGLCGIYGVTAMLLLASIVRTQYRRLRCIQPAPYGLDPVAAAGPIECAVPGKRPDRVSSALRAWSMERADADLAVPARAAEPGSTTVCEPLPEPRATNHWSRTAPAVEAPAASAQTEWARKPEPASEPAAKREEPASQPFAAEEERFTPRPEVPLSQNADYYETLQISPNADAETIHRVYRIMAARFHPDNPTTGSLERFLQLREAYQTLSDAALRAEYDASRPNWQSETEPIFWQKSFVDGIEGETNRRLGVLSLLYQRRRTNEGKPGVSVMELERRMAFPREYLNFTLWYLRSKGYVALMEDNSDYALTSAGVDYVESGSSTNKVIRELLTAGTGGEKAQPAVAGRSVVVPFPRPAARPRVEGVRRTLRRRQAGRR